MSSDLFADLRKGSGIAVRRQESQVKVSLTFRNRPNTIRPHLTCLPRRKAIMAICVAFTRSISFKGVNSHNEKQSMAKDSDPRERVTSSRVDGPPGRAQQETYTSTGSARSEERRV